MTFMDDLARESYGRKTLTENGAVAYGTSGKAMLDFNFSITQLRNSEADDIVNEFKKVFYDDKTLAIKYLFYVGDIRQGLGERNIFRSCIKWLSKEHAYYAKKVINLIPEYSRWDILISLVTVKPVKSEVVKIINNQLRSDIKNCNKKPISLLAKWMPSENASSRETKKLAHILMKELKMTPRKYRQTLSKLRKYLDVVEIKMSSNNWDKIIYEKVPSKANLIYSGAFLRNDTNRRIEYIDNVAVGKTKINASVTQPHEVVHKYCAGRVYSWMRSPIEYDETLEHIWKAIPKNDLNNTLVVRDGSGSMTVSVSKNITALDVATAMAVYCSENCSGQFKDKFVTFSSDPKIVDLSGCESLRDKLDLAFNEADISTTNIFKTMMLILSTAVKNSMEQEDLPDTILIISDMQFNGHQFNFDETLFEEIRNIFKDYGYQLPRICFWNLRPHGERTIPLQENDFGLILCSGFSPNNLKMFMSGEIDPLKILLEEVNSKRYDEVEKALLA